MSNAIEAVMGEALRLSLYETFIAACHEAAQQWARGVLKPAA